MATSVVTPALEMAQETGKLVSWKKRDGEAVKKGEILLEIETDKAVVEIEAQVDGTLGGVTGEGRGRRPRRPDDRLAAQGRRSGAGPHRPGADRPQDGHAGGGGRGSRAGRGSRRSRSPARASRPRRASSRASMASTSPRSTGSGPGGEILADDIIKAAAPGTVAPAPAAPGTRGRQPPHHPHHPHLLRRPVRPTR